MRAAAVFLLIAVEFLAVPARAQTPPSSASAQSPSSKSAATTPTPEKLIITVTDETGVAVGLARVQLQLSAAAVPLRCVTDFAGRCEFSDLPPGTYELRIEKSGFYTLVQPNLHVGLNSAIDVTLSHPQQAHEVIDVTASGASIDQNQIASHEELTGDELIDIPYPGSHDYHNALNLIPGVTPDSFGQLHIAGAENYQTLVLLDGFNVSQPTNGQLAVRTSIESFRSIEVTPSREPAEFGKGSGGVLTLNTAMGKDVYRFTTTDFVPGMWWTKGRPFGQWTPIDTFSGPIVKGKVWFLDALDGEFDDNVDVQLPLGQDRDYVWRADNLAKVQANLTSRNIVTASFLSNYYHDRYDGLAFNTPPAATPTEVETAFFGSLKDQYYFRGGTFVETGFGVTQYDTTLTPQGDLPYIELFFSAGGNYYLHENSEARRVQLMSNLFIAPRHWHGRHDFKIGFDLDRLNYDAQFLRQPISFEPEGAPEPGQTAQPCATDAEGVPVAPYTCTRYSVFSGGTYAPIYNAESSAYAEDRWLLTNHLLIEPGLRFDWDELARTPIFSPRLAGTYVFDDEATTKLSAGIGLTYDSTNLGLIHQPLEGARTDYFFSCIPSSPGGCSMTQPTDANGNPTPEPVPVPTSFAVNRNALAMPRYENSSASLEKKFPYAIFVKVEILEKRGVHAYAYNTLHGAIDGVYLLGNGRDDRYDALTFSVRHRFRSRYEIFGAYTRSTSHSNQIFDFSLDIPLLSPQLAGPYGWDVPNRFVGWGVLPGFNLPLIHKFDIVYSAEARNGLPYYGTTDQGEIAANYPPSSSLRLPVYYALNLEVEKRFHLFGRDWAGRAGFDDITNHPIVSVFSTIDAAHPAPTFVDGNGRAFDVRIRLLGKTKQ